MTATHDYDAIVVGAGPYGLSAAAHLRGHGLRTGVVGQQLGEDAQLAQASRDQLGVLAAIVEDHYFLGRDSGLRAFFDGGGGRTGRGPVSH